MNYQISKLPPGVYLVATPIGRARDITLHALDVLASADVLAAEDTRNLRKLMELHGVPLAGRRILAYHDHNGARMRPQLLQALDEGKSIAYASDAGTPLVADPGHGLAVGARAEGHMVTTAPGPSAAIAALTIAGLASDRFLFAGFAPNASAARRRFLEGFRDVEATLIFYESPKRAADMLAEAADVLGGNRRAALCRELTKKFEDVVPGTLKELAEHFAATPPRGECVVLIEKGLAETATETDIDGALRKALETMRMKDAATAVAGALNLPRRDVYQRALALAKEGDGAG